MALEVAQGIGAACKCRSGWVSGEAVDDAPLLIGKRIAGRYRFYAGERYAFSVNDKPNQIASVLQA